MNGKQIRYIFSVVISTIIIGLIFVYVFKYFRRHMVIRAQKQDSMQIDREIIELQALGFRPDHELIALLQEKRVASDTSSSEQDLEKMYALQKKMLMSYVSEAKSLRKRGVDVKSPVMRFAYDKIVRLTIGVAELERQIKGDGADFSEFAKRVDRMREITQQSIAHYKKQLREYMRDGVAEGDERVQLARNMLTTRIKHLYQM